VIKILSLVVAISFTTLPAPLFAASKTFVWERSYSFEFPRVRWCADDNSLCGQVAANYYCERKGFEYASHFVKDISPEALDGDPYLSGDPKKGAVYLYRSSCKADACKTFASITCVDGQLPRHVRPALKLHQHKHNQKNIIIRGIS
jgi:hypothetical protein